MTKFKTGHDPRRNTRGRPKNKANQTTEGLRDLVKKFLSENWNDLEQNYSKLSPEKKLHFIEKMLRLTLPPPVDELERLTDEQIKELITKLRKGEL